MNQDAANVEHVAWPPESTEPAPVGCLEAVGYLVLVHYWMALHVALASGALFGVAYALLPPIAMLLMLVELPAFFAFATLTAGTTALLLAGAWRVTKPLRSRTGFRLTPETCGWLLPVALVWTPVLAGEIVSRVAITRALVLAKPQCHGVRGFMASLRDYADGNEYAPAHAWYARNGEHHLWSYREMAFVPDKWQQPFSANCR